MQHPSSNTRSSGTCPQRECYWFQSCTVLSQKLQSSGICDANSNQRCQTRRKSYEFFDSSPKSPSGGMTFQWKIPPSISGGRRVDTFNKELRVRLSRIIALSCSSICLSNGRMESRSIFRSIVICKTASGAVECLSVSFTHTDGDVSLRFAGG